VKQTVCAKFWPSINY